MRTSDDVGTTELAAATVIGRAAMSLAARARAERAGVLSLNETAVLGRLATRGPMTAGEVATQLRAQPQSLTRTFASLESAGLMRRTPDPADGRQALLGITSAGRRSLKAEMKPRDVWLASAMSRELTTAERDLLVVAARLMERLADVDAAVAVPER
jgi:DNA-binding MarR family transcriptional regulator